MSEPSEKARELVDKLGAAAFDASWAAGGMKYVEVAEEVLLDYIATLEARDEQMQGVLEEIDVLASEVDIAARRALEDK